MCCQTTTRWLLLLLTVANSPWIFPLPAPRQQIVVAPKRDLATVQIDQTVLLVNQRPLFAKIIQYNGEPFVYLRSLGFNVIQLPSTATEPQLQEAASLGLWLVCPPPPSAGREAIGARFEPVLAWSLMERATSRDVQSIQQSIADLNESDGRLQRPVYVHASSHWRTLARSTGILGLGTRPLATNFVLRDYHAWIEEKTLESTQPIWVDVQTEVSAQLERQARAISSSRRPIIVEPQQLKFMLYEAVAAGARGFRFLSRSPLDAADPASQLRAMTIHGLLRHVDQLAPWLAAGLVQPVEHRRNSSVEIHSVKLPGSTLLLIQRTTGFEQWCCGDLSPIPFEFLEPSSSPADRAYLINELGANPLPDRQTSSGSQIQVPACPYTACILLTQDPTVLPHFNLPQEQAAAATNLRRESTQQWLSLLHLTELSLAETGQGFPLVGNGRMATEEHLRNAGQMIRMGNLTAALNYLDQADAQLAGVRRTMLEQNASQLFSTPLLMSFATVADHLRLSARLATAAWNPNGLTAGDFENLQQLTDAGWINRREDSDGLTSQVELLPAAAIDGTYGLSLKVTTRNGFASGPQAPPLWIQSAPVYVQSGQLVRIHGFVNLPRVLQGSHDGLMLIDSLGGAEMATRVRQTNGWQEFTIYRVATKSGPVSVMFIMTGIGQAMIDEVTIRTLDLGDNAHQIGSTGNRPQR